jgi:hypothetical protein
MTQRAPVCRDKNLETAAKILKAIKRPARVREIVDLAAGSGLDFGTRIERGTIDQVLARDLAMEIKRNGDQSRFVRVEPGRYLLRAQIGLFR